MFKRDINISATAYPNAKMITISNPRPVVSRSGKSLIGSRTETWTTEIPLYGDIRESSSFPLRRYAVFQKKRRGVRHYASIKKNITPQSKKTLRQSIIKK